MDIEPKEIVENTPEWFYETLEETRSAVLEYFTRLGFVKMGTLTISTEERMQLGDIFEKMFVVQTRFYVTYAPSSAWEGRLRWTWEVAPQTYPGDDPVEHVELCYAIAEALPHAHEIRRAASRAEEVASALETLSDTIRDNSGIFGG